MLASECMPAESVCACAVLMWPSLSVHVCRLHTIIDCDMVLVMDNGSAAEWGRPSTLLDDPNGTFSSTCLLCSPAVLLPLPFSSQLRLSLLHQTHITPGRVNQFAWHLLLLMLCLWCFAFCPLLLPFALSWFSLCACCSGPYRDPTPPTPPLPCFPTLSHS